MPYSGVRTYRDGTILHAWRLLETSGRLLEICQARGIDTEIHAKAESRRQELLGERLLAWHVFGEHAMIAHNADGVPFVEGKDLHLSVAHTRGYLAIAVNPRHAMGIDVETHGRRVVKVRDFFLSSAEKAWLDADDVLGNTIAWTAKEAIFKAVGGRSLVKDYRHDILTDAFATPCLGATLSHTGYFKGENFMLETDLSEQFLLTFACARKYINY